MKMFLQQVSGEATQLPEIQISFFLFSLGGVSAQPLSLFRDVIIGLSLTLDGCLVMLLPGSSREAPICEFLLSLT